MSMRLWHNLLPVCWLWCEVVDVRPEVVQCIQLCGFHLGWQCRIVERIARESDLCTG